MRKSMKKKLGLFLFSMIFVFAFTACGNTESQEGNSNEKMDSKNNIETSMNNKEEESEETTDITLDASLSGLDLLKSITSSRPKSMIMESTMDAGGMTTKTITYYNGDDVRTESEMEGYDTTVSLYFPAQETVYTYVLNSTEGTKITGLSMEDASGVVPSDNMELFAAINEEASPDLTARVETLNGEEVIYIESSEVDEEMGDAEIHMWYSAKYATVLKYELYMNGGLYMTYQVTSIDKNVNIDKDLFVPPADVTFAEVDYGAMFGGDMDYLDMDEEDVMDMSTEDLMNMMEDLGGALGGN